MGIEHEPSIGEPFGLGIHAQLGDDEQRQQINTALGRPPEARPKALGSLRHKLGALACVAVIAASAGAALGHYHNLQSTVGQTETIPPLDEDLDTREAVDGNIRVGTWNIEGKSLIDAALDQAELEDLDVLNLQEVSSKDIPAISRPGWFLLTVKAEAVQHGGLYNASFIKGQKPKDVSVESFDGTDEIESASCSFVSVGSPVRSISDCWQEKRAALAFTIQEQFYNREKGEYELKDVRVMNVHIAGASEGGRDLVRKGVHLAQFSELFDLMAANRQDGRPFIQSGDLNAPPEKVLTAAANHNLIVPGTRGTMVHDEEEINDYFAYHHAGILGMGRARVVKIKGSDHWMLVFGANGHQAD